MHMDCMNHYATKALKGCVRLMKTMQWESEVTM
jgi:hypothetical protein